MILPREEIVKVERPGNFNAVKLGAKSRRGLFQSLYIRFLKDARQGVSYTPLELATIFQEALNKDTEIKNNSKATVRLNRWKGKSGIDVIEQPDSFKVITYQKADQDSEPQEIVRIISKVDVNAVIGALNKLNKDNNKITTPHIAEEYCNIIDITQNSDGKPLFPNNKFDWQLFFGDRFMHTQLNLCLRLLDYYKVIKYRGGKSQVLKNVVDIQTET